MSRRAKTLLSAWASFDDPMTVLLSFYFAVPALRGGGGSGTVSVAPDQGAGADFLLTTLANVVLFAIALLVRHLVRRITAGRRTDDSPGAEGAGTRSVTARRADVLAQADDLAAEHRRRWVEANGAVPGTPEWAG